MKDLLKAFAKLRQAEEKLAEIRSNFMQVTVGQPCMLRQKSVIYDGVLTKTVYGYRILDQDFKTDQIKGLHTIDNKPVLIIV